MDRLVKILIGLVAVLIIVSVADLILFSNGDKIATTAVKSIEVENDGTYLKWRYVDSETWNNLVSVEILKGAAGTINDGANVKKVELKLEEDYVKWKYEDASTWNNLVTLAALKETNTYQISEDDIEFNVSDGYVQWKYKNDTTWIKLMTVSELINDNSISQVKDTVSNDREIEISTTDEYIRWKYKNETTWTNLIAIADITENDGETWVNLGDVATNTYSCLDEKNNNVPGYYCYIDTLLIKGNYVFEDNEAHYIWYVTVETVKDNKETKFISQSYWSTKDNIEYYRGGWTPSNGKRQWSKWNSCIATYNNTNKTVNNYVKYASTDKTIKEWLNTYFEWEDFNDFMAEYIVYSSKDNDYYKVNYWYKTTKTGDYWYNTVLQEYYSIASFNSIYRRSGYGTNKTTTVKPSTWNVWQRLVYQEESNTYNNE